MGDDLKQLAAGQRVYLDDEECVVQTARNYGRLLGSDPERSHALFLRHRDMGSEPVWLIPLPEDRNEFDWAMAVFLFGGQIPPVGALGVPLPVRLSIGDQFMVEDMRGLVYLGADGPKLLMAV